MGNVDEDVSWPKGVESVVEFRYVVYLNAKAMIPVYEAQERFYEQRVSRLSLQQAKLDNVQWLAKVTKQRLDKIKARNLKSESFANYMLLASARSGLMNARIDLEIARKVVRDYEQRKGQSTSVQDATEVVRDQGQSEDAPVQVSDGEGDEAVPDQDQGTNT